VERQLYVVRVCVCSLRYVACIAHAPNCFVSCGHSDRMIFFRSISLTGRFFFWGGGGGFFYVFFFFFFFLFFF